MIKLACDQPENATGRHKREVLGEQDLKVLWFLARGLTRDEIGAKFNVSSAAVSKWISEMRRETHARTDAHLVAIAKENGLIN